MSKSNTRPVRLDIRDLPRDPARVMGGLRKTLVSSVNYCRRYPLKLQLLRETLEVAHKYVREVQRLEKARKTSAKQLSTDPDKAE